MSRHGAIELAFGDGEYTFRLGLGEIEELERKCDAGVFQIAGKLSPTAREARLAEITETIRLGLIGGGMKPVDAMAKVRRYVDARPLDESRDVAYAVVLASLMRVHSTELEQTSGEAQAAGPDGSTSPPSTDQPSSWASTTSSPSPSESGRPSAEPGTRPTVATSRKPRPKTSSTQP